MNKIYLFLIFLTISCSKPIDKSNLLFIIVDDLGWTDVSYNGSDYYETHNIDALSLNSMLFYNALEMSFREFKLQPNPNTPKITQLIDYDQFCGVSASEANEQRTFQQISARRVKDKLDNGWNPIWIDVRNQQELEIVSIDRVDLVKEHSCIAELVSSLVDGRDVLVMCKRGHRSAKACTILVEAGVSNVFNLDGGIIAWATDIDSSLPIY